MTFLRRGHPGPVTPAAEPPAEDTPEVFGQTLNELIRFINANAGRLPIESLVAALRVTDSLREILDTATERPLDIYAIVSVKAILTDYLPTTLRRYLQLDPARTQTPLPTGRSPRQSLLEQIESLGLAAADGLSATRAQDADALQAQGSFLRTKFAGSDLDL